MPSSGMFRRVALVRIGVSDERSAFIIRTATISDLGTTLTVTSIRHIDCGSKFHTTHDAKSVSIALVFPCLDIAMQWVNQTSKVAY
jgi:hypothetical protein